MDDDIPFAIGAGPVGSTVRATVTFPSDKVPNDGNVIWIDQQGTSYTASPGQGSVGFGGGVRVTNKLNGKTLQLVDTQTREQTYAEAVVFAEPTYTAHIFPANTSTLNVGLSADYDHTRFTDDARITVLSLGQHERVQRLFTWTLLVNNAREIGQMIAQALAAGDMGAAQLDEMQGMPPVWADRGARNGLLRALDDATGGGNTVTLDDGTKVRPTEARVDAWERNPSQLVAAAGADAPAVLRHYLSQLAGVGGVPELTSVITTVNQPVTIHLDDYTDDELVAQLRNGAGARGRIGTSLIVLAERAAIGTGTWSRAGVSEVHVMPGLQFEATVDETLALPYIYGAQKLDDKLDQLRRPGLPWSAYDVGHSGFYWYYLPGQSLHGAVEQFNAQAMEPDEAKLPFGQARDTSASTAATDAVGGYLLFRELADDPFINAVIGLPGKKPIVSSRALTPFVLPDGDATPEVTEYWRPRAVSAVFFVQERSAGTPVLPTQPVAVTSEIREQLNHERTQLALELRREREAALPPEDWTVDAVKAAAEQPQYHGDTAFHRTELLKPDLNELRAEKRRIAVVKNKTFADYICEIPVLAIAASGPIEPVHVQYGPGSIKSALYMRPTPGLASMDVINDAVDNVFGFHDHLPVQTVVSGLFAQLKDTHPDLLPAVADMGEHLPDMMPRGAITAVDVMSREMALRVPLSLIEARLIDAIRLVKPAAAEMSLALDVISTLDTKLMQLRTLATFASGIPRESESLSLGDIRPEHILAANPGMKENHRRFVERFHYPELTATDVFGLDKFGMIAFAAQVPAVHGPPPSLAAGYVPGLQSGAAQQQRPPPQPSPPPSQPSPLQPSPQPSPQQPSPPLSPQRPPPLSSPGAWPWKDGDAEYNKLEQAIKALDSTRDPEDLKRLARNYMATGLAPLRKDRLGQPGLTPYVKQDADTAVINAGVTMLRPTTLPVMTALTKLRNARRAQEAKEQQEKEAEAARLREEQTQREEREREEREQRRKGTSQQREEKDGQDAQPGTVLRGRAAHAATGLPKRGDDELTPEQAEAAAKLLPPEAIPTSGAIRNVVSAHVRQRQEESERERQEDEARKQREEQERKEQERRRREEQQREEQERRRREEQQREEQERKQREETETQDTQTRTRRRGQAARREAGLPERGGTELTPQQAEAAAMLLPPGSIPASSAVRKAVFAHGRHGANTTSAFKTTADVRGWALASGVVFSSGKELWDEMATLNRLGTESAVGGLILKRALEL